VPGATRSAYFAACPLGTWVVVDGVVLSLLVDDIAFESNAKLMILGKAYDALPSGGALLLYDTLIDDARVERTTALRTSLLMLIETGEGTDYTAADGCGRLESLGAHRTFDPHLSGDRYLVGAYKPRQRPAGTRPIRGDPVVQRNRKAERPPSAVTSATRRRVQETQTPRTSLRVSAFEPESRRGLLPVACGVVASLWPVRARDRIDDQQGAARRPADAADAYAWRRQGIRPLVDRRRARRLRNARQRAVRPRLRRQTVATGLGRDARRRGSLKFVGDR
jgi:hypothetical protein